MVKINKLDLTVNIEMIEKTCQNPENKHTFDLTWDRGEP